MHESQVEQKIDTSKSLRKRNVKAISKDQGKSKQLSVSHIPISSKRKAHKRWTEEED